MVRLIKGDCHTELEKLVDEGILVDLILTDPPYNTVKGLTIDGWSDKSTQWDNMLDWENIFSNCEKLLRVNGVMCLFSQEPLTSYLRQLNYSNIVFTYPLIWKKNHFANALSCKKAPVSYFEDISVFRKKYDSENRHPLREYAQNLLNWIGVTYKDIERQLGHRKAEHFFYRTGSSQFSICTNETYNELINVYNIDEFPDFIEYDELKKINQKYAKPIFNLNGGNFKSNILEYHKPNTRYHPTQKPVDLLKDLILTYTNKGDTVLDFTMGSGSTAIACRDTGRKFIGIELDEEYYKISNERYYNLVAQKTLC